MLNKETAKKQARKLVDEIGARGGSLRYQDALDIVARLNDVRDWKTLSGLAERAADVAATPQSCLQEPRGDVAQAAQDYIPGVGRLYRVPITVDTTMTASVLARGRTALEAILFAREMAYRGDVHFEVDEGNYRGLEDYYCPDKDAIEEVANDHPLAAVVAEVDGGFQVGAYRATVFGADDESDPWLWAELTVYRAEGPERPAYPGGPEPAPLVTERTTFRFAQNLDEGVRRCIDTLKLLHELVPEPTAAHEARLQEAFVRAIRGNEDEAFAEVRRILKH